MKKNKVTKLKVCGKTDVGIQRSSNEDNIKVFNKFEHPETGEAQLRGNLYIVADGMGGHRAGEVASSIAVEEIGRIYYSSSEFTGIESTLVEAIKEANRRIYERSQTVASTRGMGTTVAAAVIRGDELYTAHVGDSRVYLIRDNRVAFVTEDHSLVREQVRSKVLTEEEAKSSPMRHVITRSLGNAPDVDVEVNRLDIEEGDIVVLCSDGLWEPVGDRTIVESASRYIWGLPEQACEDLVTAANRAGGPDNISVIVIGIEKVVPVRSMKGKSGIPVAAGAGLPERNRGIASRVIAATLALVALALWSAIFFIIGRNSARVDASLQATATKQAEALALYGTNYAKLVAQNKSLESTISAQKTVIAEAERRKATKAVQPTGHPATKVAPAQKKVTKPASTPTFTPTRAASPTSTPAANQTPMKSAQSTPSASQPANGATEGTITVGSLGKLTPMVLSSSENLRGTWVQILKISPNEKSIAAIDTSGKVILWTLEGAKWEKTAELEHAGLMGAVFSEDGKELFIGAKDGVYVLQAPLKINKFPDKPIINVRNVNFVDLYQNKLAVGTSNGVQIWRWDQRQKVKVGEIPGIYAYSVKFSHNGQWLAIGGSSIVKLCPVKNFKPDRCKNLKEPGNGRVWGLAFSPDDSVLASGGFNGGLYVHKVKAQELLVHKPIGDPKYQGLIGVINDLTFFKDGKILIGATQDGVRFWEFDSATGQLKEVQKPLLPRRDSVGSVDVSKDGSMLGAGYYDLKSRSTAVKAWSVQR